MTPERKLELIQSLHVKHPHMRISNVMHYVQKREKAEELRRPSPDPRGVVAMLRKLTGRA
ncbi:hypothetical protein [Sinorhizobium meliloti]|uniref:hypothetical protein n=1 Tax=Rhizobium meliloti TaxID=382 RepID=UPI000FD86EC6|nr:hypothetical protein [Sinorhizobium meliloti]RVQ10044.1 hypothetical protein CN067_34085 [Sinorhizobium meliloti]RVQ55759.1 hypothetical protein CN060_21160 [Sinorhizobium meliloti]